MTEEIRSFMRNTIGNSRTSTGVDVTMDGNATDDVQGLRINMSSQTSTNQHPVSITTNGVLSQFRVRSRHLIRPALKLATALQ